MPHPFISFFFLPSMQNSNSVSQELLSLLSSNTKSLQQTSSSSLVITTKTLADDQKDPLDLNLPYAKECSFSSIKTLLPILQTHLYLNHFDKPSIVQASSIPLICSFHNVACQAVAGTGKTLSFVVPAVNLILEYRISKYLNENKNVKENENVNGIILDKQDIIKSNTDNLEYNTTDVQYNKNASDTDSTSLYHTLTNPNSVFSHSLFTKSSSTPLILVISPTKELNTQTSNIFNIIGQPFNIKSYVTTASINNISQRLTPDSLPPNLSNTDCEVIVGSPGSIIGCIRNNVFDISTIKMVIVDEADYTLSSLGLQSGKILGRLDSDCQLVFFSASYDDMTKKTIKYFVKKVHQNIKNSDDLKESDFEYEDSDFILKKDIIVDEKNNEFLSKKENKNNGNCEGVKENDLISKKKNNDNDKKSYFKLLSQINKKINIKKRNISRITEIYSKNELSPELKFFHINTQSQYKKTETIQALVEFLSVAQAIIFCNTKKMVDILTSELQKDFHIVSKIHGDMADTDREKALVQFRNAESKILISTDIFSRGMDIPQVNLVINYDVPRNFNTYYSKESNKNKSVDVAEVYQHRIGRTGRFGRCGFVIDFIGDENDYKMVCEMQEKFNTKSKMFDIESLRHAFIDKETQ